MTTVTTDPGPQPVALETPFSNNPKQEYLAACALKGSERVALPLLAAKNCLRALDELIATLPQQEQEQARGVLERVVRTMEERCAPVFTDPLFIALLDRGTDVRSFIDLVNKAKASSSHNDDLSEEALLNADKFKAAKVREIAGLCGEQFEVDSQNDLLQKASKLSSAISMLGVSSRSQPNGVVPNELIMELMTALKVSINDLKKVGFNSIFAALGIPGCTKEQLAKDAALVDNLQEEFKKSGGTGITQLDVEERQMRGDKWRPILYTFPKPGETTDSVQKAALALCILSHLTQRYFQTVGVALRGYDKNDIHISENPQAVLEAAKTVAEEYRERSNIGQFVAKFGFFEPVKNGGDAIARLTVLDSMKPFDKNLVEDLVNTCTPVTGKELLSQYKVYPTRTKMGSAVLVFENPDGPVIIQNVWTPNGVFQGAKGARVVSEGLKDGLAIRRDTVNAWVVEQEIFDDTYIPIVKDTVNLAASSTSDSPADPVVQAQRDAIMKLKEDPSYNQKVAAVTSEYPNLKHVGVSVKQSKPANILVVPVGTRVQTKEAPNGVIVAKDQVVIQMGEPNNVWVTSVKDAFKRYDLGVLQKEKILKELETRN